MLPWWMYAWAAVTVVTGLITIAAALNTLAVL